MTYIISHGKDKSWQELAQLFNFKNGECARKYWQRNKNNVSSKKVVKIKEWEIQTKSGEVKLLTSKEYKPITLVEDFKQSFLDFLNENIKIDIVEKIETPKDGVTLIISLSDLHLDKYSNIEEVNEKGSIDGQIIRALEAVNDITHRASLVYQINKIILIGGNDFFHANSSANTTLKGTPVESIGRWHESFKKGLMLIRNIIDACSNISPVDYYTVLGNHSPEREWYLAKAVEAFYSTNENVTIYSTPSTRSYMSIGNSSFMLTHEINNRNLKNLPVVFVTEQAQMYANSKYRYVLTGHLHKNSETHFMSTNEEYGLTFKIMPSLSNTDKWHYDNLYIGNQKSCIGLIIHNNYGLIDEIIYNE